MAHTTSVGTQTDPAPDNAQDIYLPDLVKQNPLDIAIRTGNVALRCYCVEHGTERAVQIFPTLSCEEKEQYNRVPRASVDDLAPNVYYIRQYGGKNTEITSSDAELHKMYAFHNSVA